MYSVPRRKGRNSIPLHPLPLNRNGTLVTHTQIRRQGAGHELECDFTPPTKKKEEEEEEWGRSAQAGKGWRTCLGD